MEIKKNHLPFHNNLSTDDKLNVLDNIVIRNDKFIIDGLLQQLEQEEQFAVREKIVMILACILDSGNFREIEKMFLSRNAYVRNAAIEIMRDDVSRYEPIAERFFHHHDKDIRKFALDVFGDMEGVSFLRFIIERLYDDDINICITAIEMLGKHREIPHVIELIENKLLAESNVLLQSTALMVLSRYQRTSRYNEIIGKFHTDLSPVVLIPLTEYLVSVGDEEAIELILNLCKKNYYKDRMVAVHAVINLIDKLAATSLKNKYRNELRNLPGNSNNEVVELYIHQILSVYDEEDIESYSELLLGAETTVNEKEVLDFIIRLGETGNKNDIVLLEKLAENTEEDAVLEVIGEAIVKIKERNRFPKN